MTVYIYCLSHPITGCIRYVGKTHQPKERLSKHLSDRRPTHKTCWLKSLASKGLVPVLEILDTIENSDDSDWQHHERFWISYLKFLGCDLCNSEDGGRGGVRLSSETRRKISELAKRRGKTPEHLRNIIHANKNKKLFPEMWAKMSASQAKRKHSEETRLKLSLRGTGRKWTPGQAEKFRASVSGRKIGDAVREKLRAAWIERKRVGKVPSKEQMQKMAEINRGKKRPIEVIQRIVATRRRKSEAKKAQ